MNRVFMVLAFMIPTQAMAVETSCKTVMAVVNALGAEEAERIARASTATDTDIERWKLCITSHHRVMGRASSKPARQ